MANTPATSWYWYLRIDRQHHLGIADAVVVGHGSGRLETQVAGRDDWQVEEI
ncbi:MAG: hypothetical protein P8Z42_11445 [Anaerolineales bacterium]